MKFKNVLLVSAMVLTSLSISKVNAKQIADEKCYNYYSKDEINYILEQSDPKDLDLTCKNGTIFTDEKLYKDEHLNEDIPAPYYFTTTLDVPTYQQEKNYYCGYASTKEVIQFITGSSKSQSQYASEMGTSGSSAVVYKIRNLLNKYVSAPKYSYTLGTNYSLESFKNLVQNNINNKRPIIMHAKANSLPLYKNASSNVWHYYVINGYSVSAEGNAKYIMYVDSFKANYGSGSTLGRHDAPVSDVLKTVQVSGKSHYIIHS